MILHNWGLVPYERARSEMDKIHEIACRDGKNHLIFCQHDNIFTIGYDEKKEWPVPTVKTDRGGSISCHSPGQVISYFCFQAPNPASFYRQVIKAYKNFFEAIEFPAEYSIANPGFYIENRKIASLGFRYRNGVSLHGVSLNVDVDLNFHSQVNPCGLEGIIPTSLKEEGYTVQIKDVENILLKNISGTFNETI